MFGSKNPRESDLLERIESAAKALAETQGVLAAKTAQLGVAEDYEAAKKQVVDLEIQIQKKDEDFARKERETEHKLGLHRQQIESERKIMLAEAQAEKLTSVEEAKLAVREENLNAERERFNQEIEFRTERFEAEAATLRNLTEQILQRLPNVTASFTQHVGDVVPKEPKALGEGS